MKKVVQKLNKLNNPESFIQINTIKGFEYIDKAGEIVNKYHTGNTPPSFKMALDGLIIEKPQEKIDVLKVTPTAIWMKFSQIDSLDMSSNLFGKNAKDLLNLLKVNKLSRIGWRNYFIYEFADDKKFNSYFQNLQPIKENDFLSLTFGVKTKKQFKANLTILPVIKSDSTTKAVLFDMDIFQEGELTVNDIDTKLKDFLSYLRDESGFLSVVNSLFI